MGMHQNEEPKPRKTTPTNVQTAQAGLLNRLEDPVQEKL